MPSRTKTTTQPVFYNGVRFPGSWTEAQRDAWLKQRAREKFWNGHAWRAEKELKVAIHGKAREETRGSGAGFVASLRCKSRATEPMLSRDSNWVPQMKISRTWRPWAVWSVGFSGVRFAIYGPRQARGTAKPECFAMFRVADRPATDAGSKLHKFNLN